ncbi:MAG: Maf family protein [Candidatus Thermoplasmatota archaeon]|nr:septum formation protein Maf [Euryarchaeota archaeon]MBU4033009.1 septum formation protein Maf [Candidatus Thermoplasmatota archaeon]MBU4071929.1 septum formation protein Maf [Candidatus Thermoplasmatota archaeon]MBU4145228.1 septum formation protein Maf [Candidatus Thermoplasmatota archaeon]MBU4592283.1 Maf family protein [Candidatus Thermoplasmatota archaeon]
MGFRIVLASDSPRRKELLARIVPIFVTVPAKADEVMDSESDPKDIAMTNALRKARSVFRDHPGAIIIGADTIVVLDNTILGKPGDTEEAVSMLEALSGRTHRVITGVAVVNTENGTELTEFETTHVTFRELSGDAIRHYAEGGTCLDKAGAYGIQDVGDDFVAMVDGDYENVVGLPLNLVDILLKKMISDSRT